MSQVPPQGPPQYTPPPPGQQPQLESQPPMQQHHHVVIKRKRSPLPLILGGIGGLIAVCAICAVIAVIGSQYVARVSATPTAITVPENVPATASARETVAARADEMAMATATQAARAATTRVLEFPATETPAAPAPTDTSLPPADAPTEAASSAPTEPPASPAPQGLTIGSTGETNKLKITLNEVRHESGGIIPPKAGMEYLVINLTFENVDDKEQVVSSLLSMSVKDGTGQQYTQSFVATSKNPPDGSVAPGDKVRGEVAFEVPKDATGLIFVYEPFLGDKPISFKLDR